MPARWQSSQGPLFVRTVWMNGLHHAILSADDPLFQCRSPTISRSGARPGSCSTSTSSSSGSAHNCDDLEHCLVKLQLVLTSNQSSAKSNTRALSRQRNSSSRPRQNTEPCYGGHDGEENSSVVCRRRPCLSYVLQSSSEEETELGPLQDEVLSDVEPHLPDLELNPLSERVLQWLDLVGKTAGVADGSVSCFDDSNSKERPTSRYFSTPTPPLPPEVETRRYLSKRTLQRQRNVDVSGKTPTVTPQNGLEPALSNTSLEEDPLHVTVRGLKTVRRRRQAFRDVRAVIDETVSCVSAVKEDVCCQPPDLSHTLKQPPSESQVSYITAASTSKPQLHIFMPTLLRDRPCLRHQNAADNASECDSYWSEA
jgi:hypothetical protein